MYNRKINQGIATNGVCKHEGHGVLRKSRY